MARVSNLRATLLVTAKELRGSFRDRQTLIYTVVLPVCMYPVMFWIMVQGALFFQGRQEHTEVRVGLAAEADQAWPEELVEALERRGVDGADGEGELERLEVELAPEPLDAEGVRAWLERDELDAALWIRAGAEESPSEILYDSTDDTSKLARERALARIAPLADELRREAVVARGHAPDALVPFEVVRSNVAPQRDMLAYLLSFVLPMLLVIMCVMGAFFPAVDLTAGEKERSTAETTLLLPVPRIAVHQGKILAVCLGGVLAAALNLGALGASAGHLLRMMSVEMGSSLSEVPVGALLGVLPLALLFAFFVSAVLTGIASLAASFKEGQALLGPTQLVFILPSMAGVIPGLELSAGLAFVPVVNVVLAFRGLLQGELLLLEYALTALSLIVYAWLAIRLSVRLASRESVALSTETIPLTRLLHLFRETGHAR